jgi:hypothetical protein
MDIPLKAICFKDELKDTGKLEYNKAYSKFTERV